MSTNRRILLASWLTVLGSFQVSSFTRNFSNTNMQRSRLRLELGRLRSASYLFADRGCNSFAVRQRSARADNYNHFHFHKPQSSYTSTQRHIRLHHNHRISTKHYASVNDYEFDFTILLKDKRPVPKEELLEQQEIDAISSLVQQRSDARANGDYASADKLLDKIKAFPTGNQEDSSSAEIMLPDGYKVEITDVPRGQGGGSTWSLQPTIRVQNDLVDAANEEEGNSVGDTSVLGLAHTALDLASSSSDMGVPIDHDKLNEIVLNAKKRILRTGEQDLRGRKAADAAFWFAIAGVSDDLPHDHHCVNSQAATDLNFSLFDAMTFICLEELRRFGQRSSSRPVDIMHMIERIAAAGVRSKIFVSLQKEAARCLETKDGKYIEDLMQRGVIESLHRGQFDLHSERSLLWLWRFSTRVRKERTFLESAAEHSDNLANDEQSSQDENDDKAPSSVGVACQEVRVNLNWYEAFKDPMLPLIVDIGCGMGVSILGLSTMGNDYQSQTNDPLRDIDWNKCNFLGADLSRLRINFAASISRRWNLTDRVHFTVDSAEEIMEYVAETYPGHISLILIQFPTPFRFNDDKIKEHEEGLSEEERSGNRQLPKDAFSGFMVTNSLLNSAYSALDGNSGKLLMQSNCEDVAVFMKRLACENGFEPLPADDFVEKFDEGTDGMPQRTEKWTSIGGKRAEGSIWSARTLLPSKRGATETEVACLLKGTPVHRVLLKTQI